jgi:ATP-binding cassette subfamily F protein 3
VALAKLAYSGANFLLLDEPSNHLDITSQEILETVLDGYSGTIVLVSHDRYLIKALATQIWAIHPQEGRMVVHKGSYEGYVAQREAKKAPEKPAPKPTRSNGTQKAAPRSTPRLSPAQRRQRLQEVEAHINKLEVEMVNIQGELEAASTKGDVEAVTKWGQAYSETEQQLDDLMQTWEELMAEGQ